MKWLFMCVVLAAVLYYGWPIIQTMIVLSPIPDPSDIKSRASSAFKNLKNQFKGSGNERPNSGVYKSNFEEVPGVLGGESDEDEEDIGRDFSKGKDLNFDSDEKEELGSAE